MTQKEYLAFRDNAGRLWVIEKYGNNLEVRLQGGQLWAVRINQDWHNDLSIPTEVLDFVHRRGL